MGEWMFFIPRNLRSRTVFAFICPCSLEKKKQKQQDRSGHTESDFVSRSDWSSGGDRKVPWSTVQKASAVISIKIQNPQGQ